MKKLFFLFVAFLTIQNLLAQTKTWTGTTSTNWNTASNWSPSGVPSSTDEVSIPNVTNDPIISSGSFTVKQITISASAVLTINGTATLSVSGTTRPSVNTLGAQITVSGSLNNNGTLNVSTSNPGVVGILLSGSDAAFTNTGTATLSPSESQIKFMNNNQTATNTATGVMNLNGNYDGIYCFETVTNVSFINQGSITYTGGLELLTFVEGCTFTNSGTLTFNGSSPSARGIYLSGATLNNNACGKISLINRDYFMQAGASTTNSGLINTNRLNIGYPSTFTNAGVLKYNTLQNGTITQNTGSAIVNNNSTSSTIFTYQGTYSGTVNGIFTNEAATTSAGSYNQTANTFTSSGLPAGSQTLYAKISPSTGGCFYVVPFTFNNGCTQVATSTDNMTWNGSVSSDWTNPCNWTPNGVPGAGNIVFITTSSTYPTITAGVNALAKQLNILNNGRLTVESGANLTLQNNGLVFNLDGNALFTNRGTTTVTNTNPSNQNQFSVYLAASTTTFDNYGTLTANGGQNYGGYFAGTFNNKTEATLTASGYRGVYVAAGGKIINESSATINATGSNIGFVLDGQNTTSINSGTINSSKVEIVNATTFTNQNCGVIKTTGNLDMSGNSVFNNYGYANMGGDLGHYVAITNNYGVLKYNNLVGSVNNTANSVVVNNTTPIFTLGASYNGTVNGIFTNEAATTSAGTYTQANNTFTPSGGLPTGSQTLYAKISPSTGGCFYVVPFTYTNAGQPDYTITAAGNNLVITDVTGAGETLDISQSGSNIRFNVTGKKFSLNSGTTTNFPADIALSGLQSITVNTATGNDIINVGAFSNDLLPSLTINGGTGDDQVNFNGDITFATNANIDLDLQNDDATPGVDAVTFAINSNILSQGTGAITLKVSKNIVFNNGSTLGTNNGNLTIEANQQITPTTGNFIGISMNSNTQLQVLGSGTLTVKGKGGNDASGSQVGISLNFGGVIHGGHNTVTVIGNGGASSGNSNYGILIQGSTAKITSLGGAVNVEGTGGGTGTSGTNVGVSIALSGEITSAGTGAVTVTGRGATLPTGNANVGVSVQNSAKITSVGGNVTVNAYGGGTGTSQLSTGLFLRESGEVSAGGTGSVTITGEGGPATGFGNHGMQLEGLIKSTGGNISLTGKPGGQSMFTYGIYMTKQNAAPVSSITTEVNGGNISITTNSLYIVDSPDIRTNSASSVTLKPFTAGTAINLSSGIDLTNGPLLLSDLELDRISTGTLIIGDATAGDLTVGTNANRPSATNVDLISGGDVVISGGTINTNGGTLLLDPGTSPKAVKPTFNGTDVIASTLSFASDLQITINGITLGDGTGSTYSQLNVEGAVNLTGVDLLFAGSYVPAGGNTFTIVNNDGTEAIIGTFNNLAEGAAIPNFQGSGLNATISYVGGSGNDVVITVAAPPTVPDINIKGNGFTIANGDTSPRTEDGTDFGNIDIHSTEPVVHTFTIENTGTADLVIPANGITKSGDGDFGIGTVFLPLTVAPGGSATFPVIIDASGNGRRNATISVQSNDPDTSPYTFGVTAVGVSPEINVTGLGQNILSGDNTPSTLDDTDFGSVDVNSGVVSHTFTIQNTGGTGGDLYLNAGAITIFGTHANDFSVSGISLPATVSPGQSVTFAVNFNPSAPGTRTATIRIANNDLGESQYVFDVKGIGITPDYTITTSGNNLVITDVTGTGETLDISQSNSDIRFDVTGKTFSLNNGLATNFPAGIPLSGLQSITVNTANGNDIINVGAFSTLLPSLTINGGTGDDAVNFNGNINFAANANLDLDLQNDDAGSGTDLITFTANATISLTGTGAATLKVSKNVVFNTASSLTTVNGNLTIETNQQMLPTTAGFYGITVGASANVGSTGSGAVTLNGKGGATGGSNRGISIAGTVSGGTGTLTLVGQGGAGTGIENIGIRIVGTITSLGGNVSVTGTGGGTGASNSNFGVYSEGTITAGNAGTVTVLGTGGQNDNQANYGIYLSNAAATITSSGGNVSVTGQGGGGTTGNTGIQFLNGNIGAGGAGSVTIRGTASGQNGYGILFQNGTITSSGGNISVTGEGKAAEGVSMSSSADITAGGTGTIVIYGAAFSGTGITNRGVTVGHTSQISTSGGNIEITAVRGNPDATDLALSATLSTATNGGNITLIADDITMSSGAAVTTQTGGQVFIHPRTNNTPITLGYGPATNLSLDDSELDVVSTGTLNIGNANSGTITIGTLVTRPVAGVLNLTSGGSVEINARVDLNGGNLNINANAGTVPNSNGTDLTVGTVAFASNNDLNIVINGVTVDTEYEQLNVTGTVNLTGVDLVLSGSYTPVGGETFTIVTNDGTEAIMGTFKDLAEGATLPDFRGSGLNATISYAGGTGNNDVVITVVAAAIADINLKGNGITIDNGDTAPRITDHTDFGPAKVTGGTVTRTFTIENTGSGALTLGTVTGATTDFSITQPLLTTVPANSSTTFTVTFDPTAAGKRTATLSIANNDTDEAPYTFAIEGYGGTPFITTWKTDNLSTGSSNSTSITIPTTGTGYNYDVDWNNDGTYDEFGLTGNATHDYTTAGTYTVAIRGDFPRIYFNNGGEKEKILTLTQWGDIAWAGMGRAFWGCRNLRIPATDVPNLTGVTDMSLMFSNCVTFNEPLPEGFNTANVTTMNSMFENCRAYNQALPSSFNTAKVTDMRGMFDDCRAYNQALPSSFSTEKVTDMGTMFNNCSAYNQPLPTSFTTASVTSMLIMFGGCSVYNQPLPAGFTTASVKVMGGMFNGCSAYNQPFPAGFTTASVTNMANMFTDATDFNQDISSWDVSKVTNMFAMFSGAAAFNQNLGAWNIGAATNMTDILKNSGLSVDNYDATLIGWNNGGYTNKNLGDASPLKYCAANSARRTMIDNKGWTITGDTRTFSCLRPFITTWKTDNLSTGSSNSTSITIPTTGTGYNYDVDWNNDGTYDEFGLTGNATQDYGTAGTYTVAIRGDFPRIYFNDDDDKEKILTLTQWGDIDWKSMGSAFEGCGNLHINATDTPDLNDVTDMSSMFTGITAINQDITGWDVSNVTNMGSMFNAVSSFNQDISGWNVGNVTNMAGTFTGTAFNQDISSWDVSKVTNMTAMFGLTPFNQNISGWNVSNVTDMTTMFGQSSFNQNISGWNVSNVTDMTGMFSGAAAFDQSLAAWGTKLNASVDLSNMLDNCGMSIANYDATLTGFNAGTVTGQSLGAEGLQYCASAAARANLVLAAGSGGKGWTITGDALSGTCPPEINLKGNGMTIENGDTNPGSADDTDFGSQLVASGTVVRTFTIENKGAGTLTLNTDNPRVTLTGHTTDFTVTTQPAAASIASNGSLTFVITFDPTTTGTRTAVVSIANNDSNENPYTFTIQGAGDCNTTLVAGAVTQPTSCGGTGSIAFATTNLANGNYTLNYTGTGSPKSVTVSSGLFSLTGLSAGTYSSFSVTVAGCTGSDITSKTITEPAVPVAFSVTGGGLYCAGGTGVAVGLSGSQVGINYQLKIQNVPIGNPIPGNGNPLSFGPQNQVGSYSVTATNSGTQCSAEMSGTATLTVYPLPIDLTVTGGGISFCQTPLSISLAGSQSGVSYQLKRNNTNLGTPIEGTGNPLTFAGLTQAGTYTVLATNAVGNCSRTLSQEIIIQSRNAPTAFSLTGGGASCSGSPVNIQLSNSQIGVLYQLKRGNTPVGSPVPGTGNALSLAAQNTAGNYTVTSLTQCADLTMNNTVTVTSVVTPNTFPVTGGGTTCGVALPVGLSDSQSGIFYQLYRNNVPVGTSVQGTGNAITLGNHLTQGIYTVVATRAGECPTTMQGNVLIELIAPPAVFNLTGGGPACPGGVALGLSGSQLGILYQLKRGNAVIMSQQGDGTPLAFANQSVSGTYSVEAISEGNCTRSMSGNAIVTAAGSLPNAYSMTGGGSFCANVPVSLGLSDSQKNVVYQLQRNTSSGFVNVGTVVQGTGSALALGSHSVIGDYRVVVNSACVTEMASRTSITACNARISTENGERRTENGERIFCRGAAQSGLPCVAIESDGQ